MAEWKTRRVTRGGADDKINRTSRAFQRVSEWEAVMKPERSEARLNLRSSNDDVDRKA